MRYETTVELIKKPLDASYQPCLFLFTPTNQSQGNLQKYADKPRQADSEKKNRYTYKYPNRDALVAALTTESHNPSASSGN